MNVGNPESDNIDAALTVANIPFDRLRLRTINREAFILHWAKFSLANQGLLLARCTNNEQCGVVLRRLEEYQAILVASKLVGDED